MPPAEPFATALANFSRVYAAAHAPVCPTCGGRRWVTTFVAPDDGWGLSSGEFRAREARKSAAPRIPCPAKCAEPYGWDVARLEADAAVLAAQSQEVAA